MAQGLKQGEMRVTYSETPDRKCLTWWLPVYTSLTHRQGILTLDIDFDFFEHEVAELRQEGRTYSMVNDQSGRTILQTAGIPAGIAETAEDWVVHPAFTWAGLAGACLCRPRGFFARRNNHSAQVAITRRPTRRRWYQHHGEQRLTFDSHRRIFSCILINTIEHYVIT